MRAETQVGVKHASAVQEAWSLLSERLPRSPLLSFAGEATTSRLLLKAESLMPTGSFKIRGATYCIARMSATERACGVVAYSTGNHAQAAAKAAKDAGVKATIARCACGQGGRHKALGRAGRHGTSIVERAPGFGRAPRAGKRRAADPAL